MKKLLFLILLTSCTQVYRVSPLDITTSDGIQHFNNMVVRIEVSDSNSLKMTATPKTLNKSNNSKKFLFKRKGVYYKSGEDLIYLGKNYTSVMSKLYELKAQNIIDDNVIDEFNKIDKKIRDRDCGLMDDDMTGGMVGRNIF